MGAETKIEWATHTFNPWRGCTKVAPGCANCYAEAMSKRNPGLLGVWGAGGTRVVASETMWRDPVKWNRMAACVCRKESADHEHEPGCPQRVRPRVFCASLCDVFEDWSGSVFRGDRRLHVPRGGGEWIDESPEWSFSGCRPLTLNDVRSRLFRLIDATPNLDWLLLTKRIKNVHRMWPDIGANYEWEAPFMRNNVWLGTSVACQGDADQNVPELLQCRYLCAKVFLSVEPLIGPVMLHPWLDGGSVRFTQGIDCDWVIVGGESGPNARPCDVEWIRSVVRQCREAGVPCFVKQLGANVVAACEVDPYDQFPGTPKFDGLDRTSIRVRLRDPKGGDPSEWPDDLRVREVPR